MQEIKTPTAVQTMGTAQPQKVITYARTPDGLVDTNAYKGLKGTISIKNLQVDVIINDARIRYGHLDLFVAPVSGTGTMWVERKNIDIEQDPGLSKTAPTYSTSKTTYLQDDSVAVPSFLAEPIKELIQQILSSEQTKSSTAS